MNATAALLIVILVFAARDGVLWWLLLGARGTAAPPAVPPAVEPVPSQPAPVQPAAPTKPRFHGMASCFGDDVADRNESAYGGMVEGNDLGVALPFHFTGARPTVRVFWGGKSVDCPIVDVGPWFTNDPYWQTGTEPRADSNSGSNKSIIDLTPAAWKALGHGGDPNTITETVDWDFVDALSASAPAPSAPSVGFPPWLATMRSLIGTKAGGDNPAIMEMPKAIGEKFPDMAAYAAGYTHDSIAWCGLSAAFCMAKAGIRPPFGPTDTDKFLWAYAWANWGTLVASDDDVQPGDVIVWTWASGDHHVTLYDHSVPTDDNFWCCGGNQGAAHTVTVEPIPMSNRHVIRRAN